jgi:hypothetical protein
MRNPTYTMSTLISFSFCLTFFMIVSSPMTAELLCSEGQCKYQAFPRRNREHAQRQQL